ncbi:MAG: hypothetical protein AAF383_11215 [Cyanobacteria bacterium P01_A01_bin.83]
MLSYVGERRLIAKIPYAPGSSLLKDRVVANARQGKSRLLRSLTGLSEDVIPDGEHGHCTSVASTIILIMTGVKPML